MALSVTTAAGEDIEAKLEEGIARWQETIPGLEREHALAMLLIDGRADRLNLPDAAPAPTAAVTAAVAAAVAPSSVAMELAEVLGPSVSLEAIEAALVANDGDANRAAQQLLDAFATEPAGDLPGERFEVQESQSVAAQPWYQEALQRALALERLEAKDRAFAQQLAASSEQLESLQLHDDEELAKRLAAAERQCASDAELARCLDAEEHGTSFGGVPEPESATAGIPAKEGGDVPAKSVVHAFDSDAVLGAALEALDSERTEHRRYTAINNDSLQKRFLHEWHSNTRRGQKCALAVAFHGTNAANFQSITRMGLVVPGKDNKIRVVHGTALGLGIYLALSPVTALRYATGDGFNLLVCLVLLGGRFVTSHNGTVLVVTNPAQVLPLWGIDVAPTLRGGRVPIARPRRKF